MGGSNNFPSLKGSIINGRFGFEYRPIPSIGLGIGLSNNSLKLEPKEPAFIRALPYLLPSILLDGSGSSIFQSLLLYSAFESVTLSSAFVTYNAISMDFNFHINKDKTFDPYIGVGVIGGKCLARYSCSPVGAEARLGFQTNFQTFFLFLQLQYQALSFGENGNIENKMGSLGIGAKF